MTKILYKWSRGESQAPALRCGAMRRSSGCRIAFANMIKCKKILLFYLQNIYAIFIFKERL